MRHIWGGGEIVLPNVSHCISENEVHYNPIHDYSKDYFTTIAKESGTITFKYTSGGTTDAFTSMSYKKNDGEWVTTQYNPSNGNTINVSVNNGDKVQWKGINSAFDYYNESSDTESRGYFTSTHTVDVEGNIMSLLYGDNFANKTSLEASFSGIFYFDDEVGHISKLAILNAENLILPATTLTSYCYYGMFSGCTSLITAPKKLPATTLAECDACYGEMFVGCTSLTTAPELPATTLALGCYQYMFQGCTSLTTAPELPATDLEPAPGCYNYMFEGCTSLTTVPEKLPATILNESCYQGMFEGCTSLTTAPELPATNLGSAINCYSQMFQGCTSLNYIKAMFIYYEPGDYGYTDDWVKGVSSTGTFVKNSAATWSGTGDSLVPAGWTVQTASA